MPGLSSEATGVETLSKRTVITLQGGDQGESCRLSLSGRACPGLQRTYRSAEADALALPGLTYGLDIVLLVGTVAPEGTPDGG